MDGLQPGQVIIPHNNSDDPQQPGGAPPAQVPDDTPKEPIPSPVPSPEQAQPVMAADPVYQAPTQPTPSADSAGWQFHQSAGVSQPGNRQMPQELTWTASEYVAHEKGAGWYMLLVLAGLVAAAADYLLFKDTVSTVVIVLAAIAFGMLSARKPHVQQYALTTQGLQIGSKAYFFQDFKNFSVADEGATASIVFMPMKRFMPPLIVYVAPDIEDRVVDFLSSILPFEQHRADAVDALMRRIRF